jgi:membrane protease YdiL (CAAX protease family)
MTPDDSQATFNLLGLRLPWKTTLVVVLSTLLLTVDWYYSFANRLLPPETFGDPVRNEAFERLVFYLVIPLLVITLVFRERPAAYGFSLGDWRVGLKWVLIAWAIAAPILFFAGRTPDMVAYYARYERPVPDIVLTAALDLFGWEFLFRGFLLFALYRVAGPSAVVLQAVPFALAHLGKPPLETLSTIFGGTAFGWVAWRANSFVYAFLIHLFVTVFVVLVAVTAAG